MLRTVSPNCQAGDSLYTTPERRSIHSQQSSFSVPKASSEAPPLVPRTGRRRTQGQTTAAVCRLGVGGFLMSADISVYFVFADGTTVSWGLCLPVWTGLLSWREESLFFCVYYVHPHWCSVDCLLLLPMLFLYSEEWHNKVRLVKRSFRVSWGAHVLQKHGLFSRKNVQVCQTCASF